MNSTIGKTCDSVSVIIPAYNIEACLARAIDSVLAQTLLPDEIIVVDDGSTDRTAEIARGYGSRIRYIYQENAGLSAARNTGIRNAGSTWIALLDGDDEWLPDKLRLQIELLKRNPHLVWACSNCYFHWIPSDHRSMLHDPDAITSLLAGREYFDDYLLAANYGAVGHPNTMIFKRDMLLDLGLFRKGLAFYEDHDMWWRIAYRWPQYGYLAQPLAIYYYNRPGSLTHEISKPHLVEVLFELLERHTQLAAHYGRFEALKTRLEVFLGWILRKLLQEGQNRHVLKILNRYGSYLRPRERIAIRLEATFPNAMALALQSYKWLKRTVLFRGRHR